MEAVMDVVNWIISAPFICCGWLIVGALAGALARRVMGSQDRPLVSDIILGLAGAVVGGFLVNLLNLAPRTGGGLTMVIINLVVAIFGAIVLIGIGRLIRGR